jgi:WD40 repeat protein
MTPIAAIQLRLARPTAIVLTAVFLATSQAQPPAPRLDADGDPLPPGALYRLGTKTWRQPGGNQTPIAWSADGKRVAIVCEPGEIRILDGQTGKTATAFRVKDEDGMAVEHCLRVAWSPDGAELAIRTVPTRIIIVGSQNGNHRRTYKVDIEETSEYGPLCYSPNGRFLATTCGSSYAVIDCLSGEIVASATDEGDDVARCLSFAPDSTRVIVATPSARVTTWDLAKRRIVSQWSEEGVEAFIAAAISHDGMLAAIVTQDAARVVDLTSKKTIARLQTKLDPNRWGEAAFTPDGRGLLLSAVEIEVWNTTDWSVRWRLAGEEYDHAMYLAVSPDSKRAAFCDGYRVRQWNLETGKLLEDPGPAHDARVTVAFSSDGRLLASGSHGKDTHLWEAQAGQHVGSIHVSSQKLAFTADARQLLTVDYRPPHFRVWDLNMIEPLREWTGSSEFHSWMAVSASGTHVASFEPSPEAPRYRVVRLALPSLEPAGEMEREGSMRGGFALSRDGRLAAIHTRTGIDLCDIATGAFLGELTAGNLYASAMIFTADDRFLITPMAANNSINVWEVASLSPASVLEGSKNRIMALDLSRTGHVLAAGGYSTEVPWRVGGSNEIRLWSLISGRQIGILEGHESPVSSLAFSPDRKTLAAGLWDTTAVVWEVPEAAQVSEFERVALRGDEAAGLWEQLASAHAKIGQAAVVRLAQDPPAALTIAEKRLEPSQPPPREELQRLIKQLDADYFNQRHHAMEQLASFGRVIRPDLQATIEHTQSVEVRLRCGELLRLMERRYPQKGPRLAETRAVQLLEWIGDERAAALLKKLATGASEAHLTHEAKAALARLAR